MVEESRDADNMIANESSENSEGISIMQGESRASDDTTHDKNSENCEGIPTDMDINTVFAFPAEFRAPKA